MNKRTAIIFYVLSAYVVIQFVWWGFHIIQLTQELRVESPDISKRIVMILGEGAVFLLILNLGIWQIRRSIVKELRLQERQKNFLLSVTHELKTPLASNKLYLQTILKRDLNREQSVELVKKAIGENARLEQIIDNILNASRLESKMLEIKREEINMEQLFHYVAERLSAIYPDLKYTLHITDNQPLLADRFLMETVFFNLLENAAKYGGTDNEIVLYRNADSIGVRDQGPGIESTQSAEIFKKFYRIGNEDTRAQKGSGLGLFIVDQIVRLHGYQIACLPNEGGGADFKISL